MKKIILVLAMLSTYMINAQIDINKIPQQGKTPTINLTTPYTFTLKNGLTVMVVENHKLPKVSLKLVTNTPPSEQGDMTGIFDVVSSLMGNGTKTISKDDFNSEVEFLGASMSINAKGGSASSLTKNFTRIVELFADAAINPLFSQQELEKEIAKTVEGLKAGENSAATVSDKVANTLVYTKAHPYGKTPTKESVEKIKLSDVEKYYRENFLPNKAYMVIIGDIKPQDAKTLVEKNFASWKKGKIVSAKMPIPQDVAQTQINFVDMPNAVQAELSAFNLQDLKESDPDFFPTIVMNYILGGGFGSYINYNLREQHGFTYGASSFMETNIWTRGVFGVQTKVRNQVVADAIAEIYKEIRRMQTQDVDEEKLKEAKATYLGNFILSTENPASMANFAVNIATRGLDKDFYKNYIKNIEKVTAKDVKRVANKYVKNNKLRFVVVGKKTEVQESLNTLKLDGKNIEVKYYDKYANPVK